MKKNLFYLFALICSVSLFTACSDDDDNGNDKPVNPLVGTYALATYQTEEIAKPGTDQTIKNYPTQSPLYAEYKVNKESEATTTLAMAGLFRTMGGAILPQVLSNIELREDGNIIASYVKDAALKDADKLMGWGMQIFMGSTYPNPEDITKLAATTGFQTSPADLATWSEPNGSFLVKLNIAHILNAALGGQADVSALETLINSLLKGEPAELKELIKATLNIDLSRISDESIRMIQNWALNGVPMKAKIDGGHTYLYLDKTALDPLFKIRNAEDGTSDIITLWATLAQANIIPQDAAAAVFMIMGITTNWEATTTFNIGLDLIKK